MPRHLHCGEPRLTLVLMPLLMAWTAPAHAYRKYLNYAPNSGLVPCPGGGADVAAFPGCHGAAVCEAWGHSGCSPLAGSTAAGLALQTALAARPFTGWSVGLCSADSDGDGLTNGDELGDGCCAWPAYGPMTLVDISNPGFAGSRSARPPCSASAPPAAPTNMVLIAAGRGAVAISWSAPAAASVCICETVLVLTAGNASLTLSVGPGGGGSSTSPSVLLCDLVPGALVSVQSITFVNRAGASASAPASAAVAAGSSGSSVPAASSCLPKQAAGFYINAADAALASAVPQPPVVGAAGAAAWFVLIGLAFAVCGAIVTASRDPASWLRAACVHRYVRVKKVEAQALPTSPAPSTPKILGIDARRAAALHTTVPMVAPAPASALARAAPPALTPPPSLRAAATAWLGAVFSLDELREASPGYSIAVLAAVAAAIGCTLMSANYWQWLQFPLGTRMPIGRGLGQALAAVMGLQLLPAARFSVFLRVFGVSFERALKFHRWCGVLTLTLAGLHACFMLYAYAHDAPQSLGKSVGAYTWAYLFQWLPNDAVNPLAGTLSGAAMLVLTLLALGPVRRCSYELFLAGHALWPVAFVLAYLHVRKSDALVLSLFAAPLLLCAADFLALFADLCWLRAAVLVDSGVIGSDGTLRSCSEPSGGAAASLLAGAAAGAGSGAGALAAVAAAPGLLPGPSEPVAAFLVIDKLPGALVFGSTWAFRPVPGQFIYLHVPGASGASLAQRLAALLPHPVSISSAADPAFPGRFTVHVRSMGPGTWSANVVALVASSVQAAAHAQAHSRDVVGATLPWALPLAGARQSPPSEHATAVQLAAGPVPAALRSALRVAVAGPFGEPSVQLQGYRHFVLVAGGIGITPIAPLHLALARGRAVADGGLPGLACFRLRGDVGRAVADVRSLTTVWSVRDCGLVAAFAPMLAPVPQGVTAIAPMPAMARGAGECENEGGALVDLRVHLTRAGGGGIAPALPFATCSGRPDLEALLRAAGARAAEAEGPSAAVAVVVCGPGPLVAEVLDVAARLTRCFEHTASGRAPVRVRFDAHRETFVL